MSMTSARSNLQGAMKDLLLRWNRIREQWDDPVSREIEATFIKQVEPRIKSTTAAISQMSEVLGTAMRDCT